MSRLSAHEGPVGFVAPSWHDLARLDPVSGADAVFAAFRLATRARRPAVLLAAASDAVRPGVDEVVVRMEPSDARNPRIYGAHIGRKARELAIVSLIALAPAESVLGLREAHPEADISLIVCSHELFRRGEYFGHTMLDARLAERCVAAVDRLICVSAYIASELRAACADCPEIVVVPHAVDVEHFAVPSKPSGARRSLLFAGRLTEEKGLDIAVEALAMLGKADLPATLTVAGAAHGPGDTSRYMQHIECLISKYGLSNRVSFRGWVAYQELPSLYREHGIFLHTALWEEPFATTIMEAMAAGVPTIASASGGTPELIDHGVTGLLVQRGNAEAVAAAVEHLSNDTVLWNDIRRAARERIVKDYSLTALEHRLVGSPWSVT